MESTQGHAATGDQMNTQQRIEHITAWIQDYATVHGIKNLVVGISGGIDSSVVSTLCARTGIPTHVLSMPIHQRPNLHDLSQRHGGWLVDRFDSVTMHTVDLTETFDCFARLWPKSSELALANTRARLRMTALYQVAQTVGGIVVGTGNRVEDFGVGFFTKYGDGGVDISPIGDCMKTQVWDMGRALGVLQDIIDAAPTDGLWDDGRTDQDQLGGLTYAELELAMLQDEQGTEPATDREWLALTQYRAIRAQTLHKMRAIPVCKFDQ
jgi:NAD+ synthase